MAKLNKDLKRAVTVLVLGLIIALFLTFNSPESFSAGILYSVLGAFSILAYFIWDKF